MSIEELEEYLEDTFEMEFAEDKIFGAWRTVEHELESLHKALIEPELKDSWEEIKEEIEFMDKLKGKGYQMRYLLDIMSCTWGQGWCICKIENDNYEFIDFYRTI